MFLVYSLSREFMFTFLTFSVSEEFLELSSSTSSVALTSDVFKAYQFSVIKVQELAKPDKLLKIIHRNS